MSIVNVDPVEQIGTGTNSQSFEVESWSYVSHENYNLQVLKRNESRTNRTLIPATLFERLAYYRVSVTSTYKTLYISQLHVSFNRFLGHYLFNTITKNLPTSYVYYFLSYYASEEHFFTSKMVPLLHGLSWSIILAGFLDLAAVSGGLCIMLDYAFYSVFYRAPWNRCIENYTKIKRGNIYCYNLADFKHKIATENYTFKGFGFNEASGKKNMFDMATTQFLRQRVIYAKQTSTYFVYHYMFIWILSGLCYKQIFKRYIWKTLNIVKCIHIAILVLVFAQITLTSKRGKGNRIPPTADKLTPTLLDFDMDMFAESSTAPPVVHFLNARIKEPINPTADSTVMILSNSIYFIMRAVVFYKLKFHCESLLEAPIEFTYMNSLPIYTVWPIYFSYFAFGDLFGCIFYTTYFIMEMLTFIITYQILVETVVCEYAYIKRWMVTIFFTIVIAIGYYSFTSIERVLLYMYSKGIVTLIEITVIVYMYPLGRLIDDITFTYGVPPSKIITFALVCVPFTYLFKFRKTINAYLDMLKAKKALDLLLPHYYWSWIIPLLPIFIGMIYVILWRLLYKKQSWRMLFRPLPLWGPRDHIQRQLRKQYDSRDFISSQASRYLSRYLTAKAAAQTYKLDVYYDKGARRSTVTQDNTNFSPTVPRS